MSSAMRFKDHSTLRVLPCLLLLGLFLFSIKSPAEAREPLVLDSYAGRQDLGLHCEILEDRGKTLTIDDAAGEGNSRLYRASTKETPGFGYTDSAFWLRFTLVNKGAKGLERFLEVRNPLLDRIDLYVPGREGYSLRKSGDLLPFDHREIKYRNFVFPLVIGPGSSVFLLRIESRSNTNVPLTLWSQEAFFEKAANELPLIWMYYGLMLAMVLYNLFIFFSIRERDYLYLVLFVFFFIVFRLAYNGLAFQYLWPDLIWWANTCIPFLVSLTAILLIQFTRRFLDTPAHTPLLDRVLVFLGIVFAVLCATALLGFYAFSIKSALGMSIFSAVFLIAVGAVVFSRGFRPSIFYLIASGAFLIGSLLNIFREFGHLPVAFITTWGQQIGSALQVILFSLGLADRIKTFSVENRRLYEEVKHTNEKLQREIAEKEKTQDFLKESQSRYLRMSENAPGVVFQYVAHADGFGEFTFINGRIFAVLGLAPEQIIKDRTLMFGLVHPEDRPSLEKSIANSIKNLIPWFWEGRALVRGEYRWFQGIARATPGADGDMVGDGLILDITERKLAEEKLRRQYEEIQVQYDEMGAMNEELEETHSELVSLNEGLVAEKERLAVTLRSIGDGVITTDTLGAVSLVNPVAEMLTGWSQEEASGLPLDQVFHIIDEKTEKRLDNPFSRVMRTGEIAVLDANTVLVSRDGARRKIDYSGAPIRDGEGRIIGVVLVFRDVTERQLMEEELLRSRKIESLGIFAGGIAHDFNNILTTIVGNISLLRLKPGTSDDESQRLLDDAEKASFRAKDLTRQLLTFSRGGAPVKKTASIVGLLKETSGFALSGSSVILKFEIAKNLWRVNIDEGQMSQVVNNLVLNAKQAMGESGAITVSAENSTISGENPLLDKKGRFVKISIRDQGGGISEKHIRNIFDPYFTTKEDGRGLGLTSSYSIVKKHGGIITVDSREGEGSVFTIYLPAAEPVEVPAEIKIDDSLTGGGRILVMDDDENVISVLGRILSHTGFDAEFVRDGSAAIAAFSAAKGKGRTFDAVLMDLTVRGGMGGMEAIARLREIDPAVKAIVTSGYSNDPVMSDYKKHGFSGVITKPFRIEELVQTLREVIKGG